MIKVKQTATEYTVTADVVINTSDGIHVEKFDCGGFESKNKRFVLKEIEKQMHDDIVSNYGENATIISIANVDTTPVRKKYEYVFSFDVSDLIRICDESDGEFEWDVTIS